MAKATPQTIRKLSRGKRAGLAALALLLVGMASASAQTTTYRDRLGREIGTATRSGDATIYRDRMGRETGTAESTSNPKGSGEKAPRK